MPQMRELRGDRLSRNNKQQKPRTVKASVLLMQLREDVKAMNSAISILSQKMRHLTRNEKILGRNLIVLNKKIKGISEQGSSSELPESVAKDMEEMKKEVQQTNKRIEDLNMTISSLQRKFVTSEELKELRYIIDSINPMELATVDQVKDIVKRAIEEQDKDNIDLG